MHRIAITAAGSINALGTGVECYSDGLRRGRCGITSLSVLADLGFRSCLAAQVTVMPIPKNVPAGVVRFASRSTLLALIAAGEAWSGASLSAAESAEAAVIVGTTTGGSAGAEENYRSIGTGAVGAYCLPAWLEAPVASPADALAASFGCGGPRMTVSTACSSSAHALGMAGDWIRGGRADAVLCCGVDGLCFMTYSGFDCLHALDREPCKPFDRDRAGLTLGEGAAAFLVESWDRARARGIRPLAELVGYGTSSDAYHLTQPRSDGSGAIHAMRMALDHACVHPEEVDYINAHGTGTPLNDIIETRAVKAVFGRHAYRIPVSSTKSMVGHCLGAAGAVEALAGILAIRHQFAPPTLNLQHPDPECDLDYVPGCSRPHAIRTVMSNSYGFGGTNCVLLLRASDN